jgi:hypothetical protein
MTIKATPERYCYEVPSNTKPGKTYKCDLTANSGAGVCPCRDHQTRRQPALDRGASPLTNATLCRHLKAAYWHFLREVMPNLAEQEDRPSNRKPRLIT